MARPAFDGPDRAQASLAAASAANQGDVEMFSEGLDGMLQQSFHAASKGWIVPRHNQN